MENCCLSGGTISTAGAARTGAWLAETRELCETLVEHALARVVLGAVLLRMEKHDAATAALEEALAMGPSRPVAREAHRVLGEVLEKRGRLEAATRHYRHALDIDPAPESVSTFTGVPTPSV